MRKTVRHIYANIFCDGSMNTICSDSVPVAA